MYVWHTDSDDMGLIGFPTNDEEDGRLCKEGLSDVRLYGFHHSESIRD